MVRPPQFPFLCKALRDIREALAGPQRPQNLLLRRTSTLFCDIILCRGRLDSPWRVVDVATAQTGVALDSLFRTLHTFHETESSAHGTPTKLHEADAWQVMHGWMQVESRAQQQDVERLTSELAAAKADFEKEFVSKAALVMHA